MNIAVVRGTVLRDPTERTLANGDRAWSIDVTVSYDDRPTENLEVVWINPPKNLVVPRQGNEIVAIGRVRRRFFKTAGGLASRQEVVAEFVYTARQTSRITRALAEVAAAVSGG